MPGKTASWGVSTPLSLALSIKATPITLLVEADSSERSSNTSSSRRLGGCRRFPWGTTACGSRCRKRSRSMKASLRIGDSLQRWFPEVHCWLWAGIFPHRSSSGRRTRKGSEKRGSKRLPGGNRHKPYHINVSDPFFRLQGPTGKKLGMAPAARFGDAKNPAPCTQSLQSAHAGQRAQPGQSPLNTSTAGPVR